MNFGINVVIVCICFAYFCNATVVKPCPGGKKFDASVVSVSNCIKGRCNLRKGTKVSIDMKIRPDREIKKLRTNVLANIAGLNLPFIGVDGTSACNNMYLEDGKTKTTCPLKADTNYVYKNSFDVLQLYPSVSLNVHWSLRDSHGDVACFELPAKIA